MDKFLDSFVEWSILDGCFGDTTIHPTDIDGMVERKGKCLFLEQKGAGVPLPTGQAMAFVSLVKQGNTVIVFWGKGSKIVKMRVMTPESDLMIDPASLRDLRNAVADWFFEVDLEG
jgi:hypothetical protein